MKRYWLEAYSRGDSQYSFNFDRYDVFTAAGAPRPPQVCIDFISETFERASGTWWQPRGTPPQRTAGSFDFDKSAPGNRRQVGTFLRYARENPEALKLEVLPTRQSLPYVFKRRFYNHLQQQADHYRAGTVVVIRGYAPWDHYSVPHYHTFFVYENDPLTGMPILLAGNAGKPRIQSWEPVMSRTPQRKIEQRITPQLEWLTRIVKVDSASAPSAPPLLAVN